MRQLLFVALVVPCFGFRALGLVEVTEFMASNRTGLTDEDGDAEDWIELHNALAEEVSLNGFFLTDDLETLDKWPLPADAVIPAEGYLIVFASNKDRTDPAGALHANFRLAAAGEVVALTDGNRVISGFRQPYPAQVPDVSYSAADGFMGRPTPGEVNDISLGKPVDEVRFSAPSQAFSGALMLELTSETPEAEIYYALDGQAPLLFNSRRYQGPMELTESTFITALAKKSGQPDSVLTTRSYVLLQNDVADFESNLPLVILDSHGNARPQRNEYSRFSLTIMHNEEGRTVLAGEAAVAESAHIRIRGQSSAGFAKKQYRMEIIDAAEEEVNVSLLGLPRESDWVLGAPYADESLIRNAVVYELGREMGLAATRTAYCEVFLKTSDGALSREDYAGLYVLTEAIEIANERIDIANLTPQDNEEPRISGGYLIGHEGGVSQPPRVKGGWRHLEIMEPKEISAAQIDWISDYVNAFDQVLRSDEVNDPEEGYAKYIDVESVIDTLIINEFAREQDSYVRSAYWYKDRGGKLVSGPLWDYNLSFGVSCCFDSHAIEDWQLEHNYNRNGEESNRNLFDWNTPLLADPDFFQKLKDRYFELRQGILGIDHFHARIDRHAAEVGHHGADDSPAHRNHDRWKTLGQRTTGFQRWLYEFEEDEFRALTDRPGKIYHTWEQHIEHIKIWADLRLQWMDGEWIRPRPPKISPAPGEFEEAVEVTLRGPSLFSKGVTYYTLDGSDPRAPGGQPAGMALAASPLTLGQSATLTARFLMTTDDKWSPPLTVRYRIGEVVPSRENLIVTELNYHPSDPTEGELAAMPDLDDDDFEYLELLNFGDQPIDLVGLRFSQEIDVDFPRTGTLSLRPGEFAVVVRNEDAFRLRYGDGARIVGTFEDDRFDNGGGSIRLRGFEGEIILEFDYSDEAPWPAAADGRGSSLELRELRVGVNLSDPASWVAGADLPGERNGGSRPAPASLTLIRSDFDEASDELTLSWVSRRGVHYSVQRSVDLSGWTAVRGPIAATGGETEVTLSVEPAENAAAYYRIIQNKQ